MSYRVAENLGPRKLRELWKLLNQGGDLKAVSLLLGVSPSRACRIVRALFVKAYVPRPWTESYLEISSQISEHESREFFGYGEEMKNHKTKIIRLEPYKKIRA